MKHIGRLLLAGAAALSFTAPAQAVLNIPLPANAYITFAGLQWAWASPLPASASALTFQGTLGWRFPTAAELLNAPNATNFLFASGNTPFNAVGADGSEFQFTNAAYTSAQSAGACASPYFNTSFNHCDWGNGQGQGGPWAGAPGAASFAEQLFVRAAVADGVPEPTTWALMLLGFGAVGGALRRRRTQVRVRVRYAV